MKPINVDMNEENKECLAIFEQFTDWFGEFVKDPHFDGAQTMAITASIAATTLSMIAAHHHDLFLKVCELAHTTGTHGPDKLQRAAKKAQKVFEDELAKETNEAMEETPDDGDPDKTVH